MHIWTALVARELALLAILVCVGAGPASMLPPRFDGIGRLALAPVLGFCLGTCVTTTLLQFWPTDQTSWVLVALAMISLAVAAARTWKERSGHRWEGRQVFSDFVALGIVVLAVTGPLTYTLHDHHTVGPAAYYYTDVDNYVAEQDGATTLDLPAARARWAEIARTGKLPSDLERFAWTFIANLGSNLDATPLDSNANELLGLAATDTNAPFLIVLLLMGALGAFGAVRYFTRSRTWMAALTGCLFGGPMFLELWFDSYQAAIIAIGLTVPLIILAHSAVSTRRRTDRVLLALVVATMLTVYPLYMALFIVLGGLVLLWRGAVLHRSGTPLRPLVRPLVSSLASLAAMSIIFDIVGFTRDIRYYRVVLNGQLAFPRVGYKLPLSVLPGWIAQTREFWLMPPLGHADAKQLVLGAALPLLFLGLIGLGVWRYRPAMLLVVLAAVCGVFAQYSYVSQESCTYCAERNLLPLTPIAATLIGLGLASLTSASGRWLSLIALLGAAIVVGAVAQRARIELIRFSHGSYFLDSGNRSLLSKLPADHGSVEEEGFGLSLYAQPEQPLVYHLIAERTHGHASVILGSNLANAIAYLDFGPTKIAGPQFNPDYRYVLTRLRGVATDRQTIATTAGLGLEKRTAPLDITPYAGLALPLVRLDPTGTAWVQTSAPLLFVIAGSEGDHPVWAKLTFRTSVKTAIPKQPGVRYRADGNTLTVCVPATGSAPIRQIELRISAALVPGEVPDELFPPGVPPEGVALTAMLALSSGCTP